MGKHSIYLDHKSEILLPYIRNSSDNLSEYLQRLIKEEAKRQGYKVSTKVVAITEDE